MIAAAVAMAACGSERPAPDPLAVVPLDAGRRWRADDHTRAAFAAMREEVRRADADRGIATPVLADRLQGHLDALFAGCTMEGPAHDALHVYLSVLLPQVDAMRDRDAALATRARAEASAILSRFPSYFE